MHRYYIYVFDSSTANEAANAVKEGHYNSIIQYHSNKHRPIQHPHENLSPQKMKERESKLNRLGQLAQLTTQPPAPSQPQTSAQPQQTPLQPPPTSSQQQQPPPPQQQQQQQQEHRLDPLSSMAAMASECPSTDSYGHTIHHHPPS